MKIQIDTTNKTIKLDSTENLGKFIEVISVMLENWKEFNIETNTTIYNWNNPIYIDRPYRHPWYTRDIYYSTGFLLSAGTPAINTITASTQSLGTTDPAYNKHTSYSGYSDKKEIQEGIKGVFNLEVK